MAGHPNRIHLSIVEEDSWAECSKKFGGIRNLDDALEPIREGLSLNPEGFPQIPGFHSELHLAKTDRIEREGGKVIPALRVWFNYKPGDTAVHLLWAEKIPD